MKCYKCGAELSDDTKFCSYCGVKIEKKTPEPSQPQAPKKYDDVPHENPINEPLRSNTATKVSPGDNINGKISGFWNGLDLFCKVTTVAIVAVAILLIISVCAKRGLAIFFSVFQLAGIITALLMHKGTIKLEKNLKWIKYLVLVFAILFTVLNVMSYSWGQINRPSGTPTQNPTDYQTPGNTSTPEVKTTAVAPCSSENCIGKDYSSVKSDFIAAGFEQIKVEKVEDLQSTDADKVDTVVSVSIGEETEFTQGQEFAKDDEVVILYHAFSKCSVTIHVDFIPNIIFSKYDVDLLVNGVDEGTLEHGEDEDFTFSLEPGEYTLTFESADSSSVKGEVSLTVDCDIDAAYKISCYSDKVSIEELYVDRLTELAEGEVKLDTSASDYNYKDYKDVTTALETLGFTNIKYEILYDIVIGWTDEGEVKSVSIAGDKSFTRGDVFAKDVEIVITYHMPEDANPTNITMPKDSDDYEGMNYLEAEQAFRVMGFTNIKLEKSSTESAYYTDGEVYSVEINSWSFDKDETFKPDDKLTIKYYEVVEHEVEESGPVFYSTNDYETATKGNTGIFSYKSSGNSYDIYWIIDFDEGYVYYFTDGNGDSTCDRLKIDSGDLNDKIIITYHDGSDVWSYGLHFKYVNHPETLIMQDNDGFEYKYSTTSLSSALSLRDSKTIKDY